MEVDDDLGDELPVETDQGTMPLSQAILKSESELENALVHLMERRDYEATSLYAQLAIDTMTISMEPYDAADAHVDLKEAMDHLWAIDHAGEGADVTRNFRAVRTKIQRVQKWVATEVARKSEDSIFCPRCHRPLLESERLDPVQGGLCHSCWGDDLVEKTVDRITFKIAPLKEGCE